MQQELIILGYLLSPGYRELEALAALIRPCQDPAQGSKNHHHHCYLFSSEQRRIQGQRPKNQLQNVSPCPPCQGPHPFPAGPHQGVRPLFSQDPCESKGKDLTGQSFPTPTLEIKRAVELRKLPKIKELLFFLKKEFLKIKIKINSIYLKKRKSLSLLGFFFCLCIFDGLY